MPTYSTHHRRSIRLRGFDYARPGAYFVTICAAGRAHLFGQVDAAGRISLNRPGEIVAEELGRTPQIRPEVRLDEWVVMPNHIHLIVVIQPPDECGDTRAGGGWGGTAGDGADAAGDGGGTAGDGGGTAGDGGGTAGDGGGTAGDGGGTAGAGGAHGRAPLQRQPRSLGSFVAGFKSAVTVRVNAWRGTPGAPVWQRNYYERIVRDAGALERVRRYIRLNPARWALDRDNGLNTRGLPPPASAADYWADVDQSETGSSRTSSK